MTLHKLTTTRCSSVCRRSKPILLLLLLFSAVRESGCNLLSAGKTSGNIVFLNRDLSTGDLSQWTHHDYGLGTDVGGNSRGAGYLWYRSNGLGRRAAGMTVTPTAHASPALDS